MTAGVPFALLAAAQLLAVAAWLALAAGSLSPLPGAPAGWPRRLVVPAGALLLAAADAITGARLGHGDSDLLMWGHAAGLALVAAGLAAGRRGALPAGTAGALAPLGAGPPASVAAAVAGALAAAAATALPSRPGRWRLAAGLALAACCALLAPQAATHPAVAAVLLATRAAGALAVLAALGALARTSVLAKVVAVVAVGVLATAIATAAVVGTVVADQLGQDQARQVRQAAAGAAADLTSDAATAQQLATLAAGCADQPSAVAGCAASVAAFASGSTFTAVATPGGGVQAAGGDTRLDRASLLDLGSQPAVRQALADPAFVGSGFVVLHGAPPRLVALGVASHRSAAQPSAAPPVVVLYGALVDTARLVQTRQRSTFDATVFGLPDGAVVASSLPDGPAGQLLGRIGGRRALDGLGTGAPTSRLGEGSGPTAGFVLLPSGTDRVAALVLSAPGDTVLRTQRAVLELLFSALVLIGMAVALGAFLLGRRAVEPVRELTGAARAVEAGDLTVRPAVRGVDEVGQLAEVFAAMTGSLQRLTGDLRHTAEQQAALRARLATVLDALADGLLVSDADGRIVVINPAARDLVGDVDGRQVAEVLCDLDGRAAVDGQLVIAGAAGRPVPVDLSRAALPGGQGYVHLIRDVTAAQQLQRAKTEFLSNISHELRTPLTPLQGYADLLHRKPDLPAETRSEVAGSLAAASRRMGRVVGLLVDVASLDAGNVQPVPGPLALEPFIAERLADWRERRPDRAADLGSWLAPGLPPALADAPWLARAVDELVDNALKYTPAGTAVSLMGMAAEDCRRVRLAVRDAGPGLGGQPDAALFGDFAQADGSATRRHEGLGLGLAFVRRVAVVLDAEIGVHSTPGGATFWMDLPTAAAPGEPSAAATPAAASVSLSPLDSGARSQPRGRGGPPA